jgi:hypothetical protein
MQYAEKSGTDAEAEGAAEDAVGVPDGVAEGVLGGTVDGAVGVADAPAVVAVDAGALMAAEAGGAMDLASAVAELTLDEPLAAAPPLLEPPPQPAATRPRIRTLGRTRHKPRMNSPQTRRFLRTE